MKGRFRHNDDFRRFGRPVRSPQSFLFWLIVIAFGALAAHWVRDPDGPVLTDPTAPSAGAAVSGRAKVIDGDSIEIDGERVRLFGIDAPEGRQQCRDGAGRTYACGRVAARALYAAIGGRRVSCAPVDHDRYDREVAICTVEGRDLGDIMVRSGNALDYTQHSKGRYAVAEREARSAKRGIWVGQFEDPSAWRRQNTRQ
jgi:endonuclease YncB( thermonuclease family)